MAAPSIPSSATAPLLLHTRMEEQKQQAQAWRFLIGYLIVGMAWGLTTPFLRRAALSSNTTSPPEGATRIQRLIHSIISVLKRPGYFIPLALNLSGSLWFFLLVGQSELSMTVPITNSLAFLFTVLGERIVEKKLVTGETWIGMGFVAVGIAICVLSKS